MNTRRKGTDFEREVAETFEAAGFTVRGLESGGDHFVATLADETFHVEAKRQERLQLPIWLRQQDADCPPRMPRVLVFRQSRQPAYAVVPFAQLVEREAILARAVAELRTVGYTPANLARVFAGGGDG